MCEEGYKISLEYVQQQDQLLTLLSCDDIVIPSVSPSTSTDADSQFTTPVDSNSELPFSESNDAIDSNSNSNSNFTSDLSFVAASEDMFDEEMEDVNADDVFESEENNVNSFAAQEVAVM